MSADKRSVHTDALKTLGTITLDETAGRDAIHLAVEPVTCDEVVYPSQHIGYENGKATTKGKLLGIVDPFLTSPVQAGTKFWMIVYPRQITSLRHVWEHPEFAAQPDRGNFGKDKATSEQWLRDWCDRTGDISYEDLVAVMTGGEVSQSEGYGDRWSNEGDYLLSRGYDNNTSEIPLEVWVHLENVIGRKLPSYPAYFSCTC